MRQTTPKFDSSLFILPKFGRPVTVLQVAMQEKFSMEKSPVKDINRQNMKL